MYLYNAHKSVYVNVYVHTYTHYLPLMTHTYLHLQDFDLGGKLLALPLKHLCFAEQNTVDSV